MRWRGGISRSVSDWTAIVNNELVRVGEAVNGAEVKEYPLTAEEKQTVATAARKYSEVFTEKNPAA